MSLITSANPRSRLRLGLGAVLLTLLVAAGLLAYAWWPAVAGRFRTAGPVAPSNTRSAFQTKVVNGQVEFELAYGRDVEGVQRVTVTDPDGTLLWVLQPRSGQQRPPKIVYGVTPTDGQTPWIQQWPADGTPPPDIRGRRVKVRVETRFVKFGAGVELAEEVIDVPKE